MPPPALAGRGAPPSTLQQQAEALSRGSHAGGREVVAAASPGPALRLNGPAQAEAMQIQVGAYSTQAEAERSLAAIRDKAKDLLADRPGAAIAASSNGRAVFRARYGGFDAASAGMVCTELRRRQIDCLVARE
jgi:D-alanyl-D-alanine carboxypeptidase